VTHTLSIGYNQLWTLRVQALNGQIATDTVTVRTDSLVPTVQLTWTQVLTRNVNLLRGLAADDSGWLRAVEVSLNGGRFKRALMGDGSVQRGAAPQAGEVSWAIPIDASYTDSSVVSVVARAVDAAGNVGPETEPLLVVLDTTGPVLDVVDTGAIVRGTLYDGSGTSEVSISLDGGQTYQPAEQNGADWSFERATWAGGFPIAFAIIRGRDVYGNESQLVAVLDMQRVYLPVIRR
nr:hypothetical protein [Thermoflexales bacterium]